MYACMHECTLAPITVKVVTYPDFNKTSLEGNHFPLPWLWVEDIYICVYIYNIHIQIFKTSPTAGFSDRGPGWWPPRW